MLDKSNKNLNNFVIKTIVAALLIATVTGVFCACSSNEETKETTTIAEPLTSTDKIIENTTSDDQLSVSNVPTENESETDDTSTEAELTTEAKETTSKATTTTQKSTTKKQNQTGSWEVDEDVWM